jgi:hypothetical protein
MRKTEVECERIIDASAYCIHIRPPSFASARRLTGVQGGSAPLPEEFISQPPSAPFHMPVAFMAHFIKPSTRFRIA